MSSQMPFDLAEMPLQGDRRLKLFRALGDNDSYYELSIELTQLAEELAKCKNERIDKARTLIENDRWHETSMLIMLHTIPKALLRSIILNTVAYDFSNRTTAPPPCYSADGPGTYVAAMSIRGRNGEFLCVVEIEDLIQGLRKYCKAYIRQKAHQGPPSKPEDKALDESAREVDATFGSRSSGAKDRLRFIRSDDAHQRVLWLIESFEDRCRPVAQQGLSRVAFQKQGPLMVGCSNQMDDRMPHHDPKGPSGLGLTTYTWALTLCLIKNRLGLDPVVTVRPVVRTWENNLLVTSEVLVTALAGSYVFQEGFNVIGAGSQAGDKPDNVLTDCKHYIFVDRPFFGQNVDATLAELQRREKYVDDVNYIAEQTARDPEDSLARVKAELLLAEATKVWLEMARTEAEARVEQLRERRIALHNQLDMLEDVREIIRILGSHMLKRGGDKEQLDS
ncbi:hypothetical protein DL767_011453 [Monosporascus sp. MG133]|nr:hypothetical protein DL767_011453 [Monosporascus sp. MG133]